MTRLSITADQGGELHKVHTTTTVERWKHTEVVHWQSAGGGAKPFGRVLFICTPQQIIDVSEVVCRVRTATCFRWECFACLGGIFAFSCSLSLSLSPSIQGVFCLFFLTHSVYHERFDVCTFA